MGGVLFLLHLSNMLIIMLVILFVKKKLQL